MHKKIGKNIVRRVLGGLLLGLYLLLAMLNSSVVQSYLGALAGNYFSKEWGGKVRIGAVHASPFSHVLLDKIELISPTNDTLYCGDRISCRFKRFPYHTNHLQFSRVYIRNGRYHYASSRDSLGHIHSNLDYITHYYPAKGGKGYKPFMVDVNELRLRNVDYIQDLPEPSSGFHPDNGVDISRMRFIGTTAFFRNVHVDGDSVNVRIVSLSTTESSGLHVVDLSVDAVVSPHCIVATNLDLQTDDSRVFLDSRMDYSGWDSMQDYFDNVRHNVTFKQGTEVNLRDAAYWAPTLWGMDCKVALQGKVQGTLSQMTAQELAVSFGEESYLFLDAKLGGLPYLNNSTFDIDIHRLHTTYADLAAVKHPEPIVMAMPKLVESLGQIDINATLSGNLQNFQTFLNVNTLVGDLECQLSAQYDAVKQDYVYIGDLDSRSMGIRSLLPNEWVTRTGFHFALQGEGFEPQSMVASLEGRLYNTEFKGYDIARSTVSLDYDNQLLVADVRIADPLVNIDISAEADLAGKKYQANLVGDADLAALDLVDDSVCRVSTHLKADLRGDDLEQLTGNVSLVNTHAEWDGRQTTMKELAITATEHNGFKRLDLNSDWLDLSMNGYVQYADIPLLVQDFCNRYLPTYYNPFRDKDSVNISSLYADIFDFDIHWSDSNGTFAQLVPNLKLAEGSSLHGSYNYGDALKMVFRSDSLVFCGVTLHDIGFNSSQQGDNYQVVLKATDLLTGKMPLLENVHLNVGLGSSISTIGLMWDDHRLASASQGDVELFLTSTPADNKLMVTKPTFFVKGKQWTIVCPKGIWFNNDRLSMDNLKVYGLGQSIAVKAHVEGKDDDFVKAAFQDFSVDQLMQMLVNDDRISVQGRLDGLINMRGLQTTPYFDADLVVEDCYFNGQSLGRLDISSDYNADKSKLYLDLLASGKGSQHPLSLQGYLLMDGNPKIDFDVNASELPMEMISPLLAGVATDVAGSVSAEMHVGGGLAKPRADGALDIKNTHLTIAATGVTYYIDNQLSIVDNSLHLSRFALRDNQDNKAYLNGDVVLGDNGLVMDLLLATNRVMVLDKEPDAENFYGKIFASTQGSIRGPANKLRITADVSALDGSELFVPINNRKQVSENEYITFVTPDRRRSGQPLARTVSIGPDIDLSVAVSPGMKLHLPMNFDQLSANVNAVGRGDIKVSMHEGGRPEVLGNYQFTSGSFSLSLLSLLSKTFDIEEGSTLYFPGNIDDANFNISAVYNLRANLATLMTGSLTNDTYVQVQDVIKLSGTLSDPQVSFDIRMPNAEQGISEQVFSFIDKNNERDMLNQSISLLVMGRFAAVGSIETENEGINGIGLLTSSVGGLVSNMVKVVDVNFNYQSNAATSTSQFDVGISKQWNKLYFESTFGYGNINSDLDISTDNVLVGDVELGYKFTPYFHFYGFQRSNTSYFTRTEMPYKQGLGIKLSKDFDSFYDLFPWLRPKTPMLPAPAINGPRGNTSLRPRTHSLTIDNEIK